MASTPEGKVKSQIDKILKQHGAWFDKPVKNGMGKPSLDYSICHQGLFAAIEAKAPGKHLSPRQVSTTRSIIASGGSVFFIDGSDVMEYGALIGWLKVPSPNFVSLNITAELTRHAVKQSKEDLSA